MRALIFVNNGPCGTLPALDIDETAVVECVETLKRRGFRVGVDGSEVMRDYVEDDVKHCILSALLTLGRMELLVVAWIGYAIDNGNGDVRLLPCGQDVTAGSRWHVRCVAIV
jgi:hypothetical protein